MIVTNSITITVAELETVPNQAGVFLIRPREGGEPYLGRTGVLRRRLMRLLGERDAAKRSRLLHLREVTESVEYWLVGSQLESRLLYYELARHYFPDSYLKLVKLRMPAYVKLTLANEFPRTAVTTRVSGGGKGQFYGPFRTRAAADYFDSQFLDLFQIRRCEENLEPRAEHPGCIYGEMNLCLRPCQAQVTAEQYRSEVSRVEHFFSTDGTSLLEPIAHQRERFSEELNFEEAARQHKRHEKVLAVLALRDALVCDIERLCGVVVAPAVAAGAVHLWFVRRGFWHGPVEFPLTQAGDQIVSMDTRLRALAASALPAKDPSSSTVRQEHLALLARWFYSSWRDGEWVGCASLDAIPYRKLVNAIGRVAKPKKG